MNRIHAVLDSFGSAVTLAWRAFASLPSAPRILKRTAEHGYYSGYTTLPIISILCFFIGSVLALQSGISMQDFGAKQFIGTLVGLSMARELGPDPGACTGDNCKFWHSCLLFFYKKVQKRLPPGGEAVADRRLMRGNLP
jgi:hypothetical protein